MSVDTKHIECHSDDDDINETNAMLRAETHPLFMFFFQLVTAPSFNCTIFCLIIANTLVLAADDYP